MSCYHPTIIKIYESPYINKKITKFEKISADDYERIRFEHLNNVEIIDYYDENQVKQKIKAKCTDICFIPCGNCIGCALDNARNWQTRLIMENEYHKKGYFLTFTYNDDNIPKNGQLSKEDAKQLIKKLQNYAYRNNIKDFKYYLVGEYGTRSLRAHMHMICRGINIDKELKRIKKTNTGNYIYESKTFNKLWEKGFTAIGELTPDSIGYVCRYATKKQTRTRSEKKELIEHGFIPEFMYCSKGIGDQYYIDNFDKLLKNEGTFYINGKELHTERRFKKIAQKLGREKEVDKNIIDKINYINLIDRQNLKKNGRKLNDQYLDKERLKKQQIKILKRNSLD